MIYLIGGPPRCGKTTLAKEFGQKLGIPCVPADYLTSTISPYIPKEDMEERLPRWYARLKTDKSNDRLYTEYTPQEIVSFYRREALTYWLGVKNFILYALHDSQDFVIEGNQLRPDLVNSLVQETGAEQFKVAFLYKSGGGIVSGLKASQDPNDWIKPNTSEDTYVKIARMIEDFSAQIRMDCGDLSLPCYDTSGNFQDRIAQIVSSLIA